MTPLYSFFVMILMNPYAYDIDFLCLDFLYHSFILSHLPFAIMAILITVNPTPYPLLTHSLLLSIFNSYLDIGG